MNLSGMSKVLGLVLRRGGLALRHYSPEIFTGAGVVGVVVTVVVACKSTLKLDAVLDETKEQLDKIKDTHENLPEKYSEEDAVHDKIVTYKKATLSVAKLYAPAVAIGVISIGFILYGHRILRKENAAVTAAYMALSESFKRYRARVADAEGPEKDREYRYGVVKKEIETIDENGEIIKKSVETPDALNKISPYARWFDEENPIMKHRTDLLNRPENILMFLRSQQNYANDMLKSRGHLFLNEVYDLLCIPRTEAGQYVGWVDGMGDSFVDFGIYDINDKNVRKFVNGYEPSILLDFNVDGPIAAIFTRIYGPECSDKLLKDRDKPLSRVSSRR